MFAANACNNDCNKDCESCWFNFWERPIEIVMKCYVFVVISIIFCLSLGIFH